MLRACTLAVALAIAAPAIAQGAVLQPLKRCYVSVDEEVRERIAVSGTGFTPGVPVEIRLDGKAVGGAAAADDGSLGPLEIKAPYHEAGVDDFVLEAVERDNPANSVRLVSRVAALDVEPRPVPFRPRQRIRWVGRGFTGPGKVFAHYTFRGAHRRTVALGRARGACGRVRAKRRQFPFKPDVGTWQIRFDQQRRYRREPRGIYFTLKVKVARAS